MRARLDVVVRPESIELPKSFGLTVVLDYHTWEGIALLDLVHVNECILVRLGRIGSG